MQIDTETKGPRDTKQDEDDVDNVEMDEIDPHTGTWRKSGVKASLRDHAAVAH